MREWLYTELKLIASKQMTIKQLAQEFECTEFEITQAIKKYQIDFNIPKYRVWTPEERARLKQLRAEGKSVREISQALNRTTNMINVQSYKMGVTKPRAKAWETWQEDTLVQLRESGFQFTFIAECLGKSPSACSMRYYRMTGKVK